MSTLHSQTDWTKIKQKNLDSKYEKCRNITEEIYKRINLTFPVKKFENPPQSDLSESASIDSNDLSNETDLFACDKSSISSSTELDGLELGSIACEKYININNNEERVKQTWQPKRPKKRFRKRIKKQQKQSKQSDGSSDEGLPLSRVGDIDVRRSTSPERPNDVMGVPNIVIITSDLKYKIKSPTPVKDKKISKPEIIESKDSDSSEISIKDKRFCKICNLVCRGERGLRRHLKMSHFENPHLTAEQRNSQ
ncbi:uncharacterized protein LOC125061383 [Pieris napi]|uniref:uncharacterized protein LOC125061383 n=1 Tax=Pieris napi TaxID=78633 RepID=UPI001FB947E8|nr:uncharacterized protein LOC125061383 [Pieris napi]